jgi:hypothetical protein
MASEVIRALFEAKETISGALEKAQKSTDDFENQLADLNLSMSLAEARSNDLENEFDQLAGASNQLSTAERNLDKNLEKIQNTLHEVSGAYKLTAEEQENLRNSLASVFTAARKSDDAMEDLRDGFYSVATSGNVADSEMNDLANAFGSLYTSGKSFDLLLDSLNTELVNAAFTTNAAAQSATGYADTIQNVNLSTLSTIPSQELLQDSIDDVEDEMSQASRSAANLSSQLGILSAMANTTSLEFGNLSVNIGPFNLSLENIIVQLPAVITGMGTMLAIVSSLAVSFGVLAGTLGALVAGGGLAWFEEFSQQFEDSAEAAEALMGALRDLFTDAMEPLMTDANMDLFIDAINGAARVVNRFAQFFNQMRGDIMTFLEGVSVDMDKFFESMHDSFIIMMPILQDFLNWFLNDVPQMIVRFSKLTQNISDDISTILAAIGSLIDSLLDLASVIIAGLAPVISFILGFLSVMVSVINSLEDSLVAGTITMLAFAFVVAKLATTFASLSVAILNADLAMWKAAASGNSLARTYLLLRSELMAYIAGEKSLRKALLASTSIIRANTIAWLGNARAKLLNISTSNRLIGLMAAQVGILKALIGGQVSFTTAVQASATSMWVFTKSILASAAAMMKNLKLAIITSNTLLTQFAFIIGAVRSGTLGYIGAIKLATLSTLGYAKSLAIAGGYALAGFVTSLIGAISTLAAYTASVIVAGLATIAAFAPVTVPVLAVISAVAALIGLFSLYFDWIGMVTDAIGGLINKLGELTGLSGILDWFGGVWEWIAGVVTDVADGIVSLFEMIPGSSLLAGTKGNITDPTATDDIQTNPNVNLSFEDSIEQNMEVNADPEDKEGIRRIVKDAMNEANSIARRQQGMGR